MECIEFIDNSVNMLPVRLQRNRVQNCFDIVVFISNNIIVATAI